MTGSKLIFWLFALLVIIFVGMLTGLGGGIPALALVIGIIGLVAIFIEFRLGVVALVLMMPLTATIVMPRQLLGIPGFTPLNAVLALTFTSLVLVALFSRRKFIPIPWNIFLPIIFLLALGTYVGAGKIKLIASHFYLENPFLYRTSMAYAFDEFVKPCVYLIPVWMIAVAVVQSEKPDRWLNVVNVSVLALPSLIIALVIVSGYSLRELATPAARTFLSATGLHANALSVLLLPTFAAALFMFPAHTTLRGRIFGLIVLGASTLALLFTFSRAAFLGVLLVTGVFFFLRGNFRYILAGLVICAFVAAILPDAFIERATTGFGQGGVGTRHDTLTAGRVGGIWLPLLPEVLSHLMLGDGVNSTPWSLAARTGIIVEGHPHNAYLRVLMDHGLVGLAVVGYFLWQVWTLFRRCANNMELSPLMRAYFNGMSVSFAVFLVQCVSGSRLVFDYIQVFYWFAIAIGLALEYRCKIAEAGKGSTNAMSLGRA
ncbi:O-antigen ligase family protein [Pseudoduganella danionis]|uniref:O-antigen ligase family protein n=1 Tax=Pseudoduganella danionis TaxID=1890295 RepID=UPI0035B4ED34